MSEYQKLCRCGKPALYTIEDGPIKVRKHRCAGCYGEWRAEQAIKSLVDERKALNSGNTQPCLMRVNS